METHKNLYEKLCSIDNFMLAYQKAKKGKSKKKSVIEFEKKLQENLLKLHEELGNFTYKPLPLRRFVIRDPKTRVIHASAFRDRIVHHSLINLIGPIFEKTFIHDSYASRINKGTHSAIQRFDEFKRKISRNGKKVKIGGLNNNHIEGYCLKIDIRHYFDTVDHEILISIIKKKIKDDSVIWLTRQILNNLDVAVNGRGMPLGNYTSQFFANLYLNEMDYFIKNYLKAKYYIRYVDDLVILHRNKKRLEYFKRMITKHLKTLNLEIHPGKSKIIPLRNGVSFLGYRVFYHHKLLRKRNLRTFYKKFDKKLEMYKTGNLAKRDLISGLKGWFGYSQWANTHKIRNEILATVENHSKRG